MDRREHDAPVSHDPGGGFGSTRRLHRSVGRALFDGA